MMKTKISFSPVSILQKRPRLLLVAQWKFKTETFFSKSQLWVQDWGFFLAKIFQIKKETEKNLSRLWFAWHLEYQIVKTETFIKPQFFLFSRLRLFLIRQKLWKFWIFRSLVDLCWHFCCTFENCFIMAYIPRFLHYKTCLAHIALIWIKIVLLSVLS